MFFDIVIGDIGMDLSHTAYPSVLYVYLVMSGMDLCTRLRYAPSECCVAGFGCDSRPQLQTFHCMLEHPELICHVHVVSSVVSLIQQPGTDAALPCVSGGSWRSCVEERSPIESGESHCFKVRRLTSAHAYTHACLRRCLLVQLLVHSIWLVLHRT